MRRLLTVEIMEHLITCGSSFMISAFFAPYGQGLGMAIRETERLAAKCPHVFSRRKQKSVSATLSRLKKCGFVTNNGLKKKAVWEITKRGQHHFKQSKGLELPAADGKIRLVLFDVPEKERRNRDWLRTQLVSCDYTPLQKSVWTGFRPLPVKLLNELKARGLVDCVSVVGLEKNTGLR